MSDIAVSGGRSDNVFKLDVKSTTQVSQSLEDISLKETKKLVRTFHEKMEVYPKYLSPECSTILCVRLSIESSPTINIIDLPEVDRVLILSLLPAELLKKCNVCSFIVNFDDQKDFKINFISKYEIIHSVIFFNSIIHPDPTTLREKDWVKIQEKGNQINIDGKIVLKKENLMRAASIPETIINNDSYSPRKSVSGKNAFELRTDIMQMAVDYSIHNKINGSDTVVDIAKQFYEFVENKTRC